MLASLINAYFVYSSNSETKQFLSSYFDRQNKLYEIYQSFGYGGGIHAFKNYILRFKDSYRLNALRSLNKTKSLINDYQSFSPLATEEIEAMKKLETTVDLYISKIGIAQEMIKINSLQSEIDKVVKVDDQPALKALKNLQKYFLKKRDSKILRLKSSHSKAMNILISTFTLSFIIAIIMGHTISRKILFSIKKLTNLASLISKGNYEHNEQEISSFADDELKTLAKQMLEMGHNLDKSFKDLKNSNQELNQFAYIISHDLQSPIKIVSTYIELLELESKGKLETDGQKFFQQIKTSTNRIFKLIKELQNYTQISVLDIQYIPVDLNFVLNESLTHLEEIIQNTQAKIHFENLPIVVGDTKLLIKLFMNLLSNSLKFKKTDSPPIVHIDFEILENNKVNIEVRDNSIGFNTKYIDTIMRPFGKIHSIKEYSGLGMGLPICKKILELHDSTLSITSKEQEGSTFSFQLKLAKI